MGLYASKRFMMVRQRQRMAFGVMRARKSLQVGDPGLFGSIGKLIGKAAPFIKSIPGIGTVASVAGIAGGVIGKLRGAGGVAKVMGPGGGALVPWSATGAAQIAKATGGRLGGLVGLGGAAALGAAGGYMGARGGAVDGMGMRRRYRRMNPLNHKAANRAVRRIKAVRKLCRSIESSLPKQRATAKARGKR